MKKGKLIVLEGTDCSGKETQSNMLVDYLNNAGIKTIKSCFPNYDSPTGKIIAGAYLGKAGFMDPVFPEGASNVNPYCASLLYAMDRKYNIENIQNALDSGVCVVLDRYVDSNMAHQTSKLPEAEQEEMINFLNELEYGLLKLPRADFEVLLYMPTWASKLLKANRQEAPDQHEQQEDYLLRSEKVYLKIADRFNIPVLHCTSGKVIKSKKQISEELCNMVEKFIKED
jgi:dTMP kinase